MPINQIQTSFLWNVIACSRRHIYFFDQRKLASPSSLIWIQSFRTTWIPPFPEDDEDGDRLDKESDRGATIGSLFARDIFGEFWYERLWSRGGQRSRRKSQVLSLGGCKQTITVNGYFSLVFADLFCRFAISITRQAHTDWFTKSARLYFGNEKAGLLRERLELMSEGLWCKEQMPLFHY